MKKPSIYPYCAKTSRKVRLLKIKVKVKVDVYGPDIPVYRFSGLDIKLWLWY